MKRIVNLLIFSVLLIGVIISCQSNTEKKKVEAANPQTSAKELTTSLPPQTTGKEHPGKAVYDEYCLACHQADGSGVPGMHPPLSVGSWVGKDPKELVAVLMKGLNGKVEVNGELYNSSMPSQAQLTDQEMADVLSFIRSSFGNNFDPINVELVNKVRKGK